MSGDAIFKSKQLDYIKDAQPFTHRKPHTFLLVYTGCYRYNNQSNETLFFALILTIIWGYRHCEVGHKPKICIFFSQIKRTSFGCNEIYVCSNLNTIFVHLLTMTSDFYKSE